MIYEELIKGLRVIAKGETDEIFSEAADAIEELTVINERQLLEIAVLSKPKWIPVTERLPDENDVVLITDSLDVGTGYLIHGYGWISPFDDIDMSHVSHWMPLPQPPKEDEP